MTNRRLFIFIMVTFIAAVPSAMGFAKTADNIMHPAFVPLDALGQPVTSADKTVDSAKTCGVCHDAAFISAHDLHRIKKVQAACVQCHYGDGRMVIDADSLDETGKLRKEKILIHDPTPANCGVCHGLVAMPSSPVALPADFESAATPDAPYRNFDFTQRGGAVFSAQNISESFLNIAGKENLAFPFDAHAQKVLTCTSCHYSPNNPVRAATKADAPNHLINDPRRMAVTDYLHAPDHRLRTAACTSCHNAAKGHDFLPYKARHLRQVECVSCHANIRYGPMYSTIDETVMKSDGAPLVEYRNFEKDAGQPLNAAYIKPYAPPLFPVSDAQGYLRVAPRNLVARWHWIDEADDKDVSPEILRKVFFDGDSYRPDVLDEFDANHDGHLTDAEFRLDKARKTEFVRSRLSSQGIVKPAISGEVRSYKISHGVMGGKALRLGCADCHAKESRLNAPIVLASYAPAGLMPKNGMRQDLGAAVSWNVEKAGDGKLVYRRDGGSQGFYVLGLSRHLAVEQLGFLLFLATLLGVFVHGGMRIYTAKHRPEPTHTYQKVYLYSAYERSLHWLIAASVLILLVTGMRIHFAGGESSLLSMPRAVAVHNAFAVLLSAAAFLFLFYHLASAAIRQFIPPTRTLRSELMNQIAYYMRGIFKGKPHPLEKSPERKMNALQQITYLLLLNVLFPLQIITGILIWSSSRWPHIADKIGGLTVVVPIHHIASWFFLSFFVLHLYLTTTGHTLFSNMKAMIDGYDMVKTDDPKTRGNQ